MENRYCLHVNYLKFIEQKILNMIRFKINTENLLLSITKKCKIFINQTHTKAEETKELKLKQQRETFHFKPPISIEGSWVLGLTRVEVHNSTSNNTEKINKFKLYKPADEKIGGVMKKSEGRLKET